MDECKLRIKMESNIVEIKMEDIASDDDYEKISDVASNNEVKASSNNYNHNTKQLKTELPILKFMDETKSDIKTEECSSDELSDHFSEPCIATEKLEKNLQQNNDNEIDTAFFDRDYKEAYIKNEMSDIEVEDHKIKLEPESKLKKEANVLNNVRSEYKCNNCGYITSSRSSIRKHLILHKDLSKVLLYFCTKCNYRTRQKCHLKRHDLVHRNTAEITMFRCNICDFKTKQKCTLKRHINSVHLNYPRDKKYTANENELLSCTKCSYTTFKKGLLISHMDKHKDTLDVNNLYICDICSFSTKYRRNLRMHLETHKEAEDLQVHECKLCNFKTRIGYCLKRHLLSRKHLLAAGKIKDYCPRIPKS